MKKSIKTILLFLSIFLIYCEEHTRYATQGTYQTNASKRKGKRLAQRRKGKRSRGTNNKKHLSRTHRQKTTKESTLTKIPEYLWYIIGGAGFAVIILLLIQSSGKKKKKT